MEIVLPKLTGYQKNVYEWLGDPYESGKIAVIKSVRQSGKTFLAMAVLLTMALQHRRTISAIYEPTLSLARNVFKFMTKALEGSGAMVSANGSLLEMELANGSTIYFKSTEQMSRGLTISGILILDECAYLNNEEIFTILPLVNAHNAPIMIISTPFTQDGYFYKMYLEGLKDDEKIKTFDWSRESEISRFLSDEKKALYKETMSRAKYKTEVLGEFLVDDGLLFTNINACIKEPNLNVKDIYIGIDFATGSEGDYTVISAVNNKGEMVKYFRTNNLSPMAQVDWLVEKINFFKEGYTIKRIMAEDNGIGKVYIDALRKKSPSPITEWHTDNRSKNEIVQMFQADMENGLLGILNDEIFLDEVRKYQAEINVRTKTITYNAKAGSHDDILMATMIAYYAYKKGTYGNFIISFA